MCAACGSLERHRHLWAWLRDELPSGPILHVAPEAALGRQLDRRPGYLSIDLDPEKAMMQADLCDLPFADDQFEMVICSHVLEHIPEDRRAMRGSHRVGQRVVMQHLINYALAETHEDPTVVSPTERLRLFDQEDHVRRYGADVYDRLREAGFEFTVIPSRRPNAPRRGDEIFDCR